MNKYRNIPTTVDGQKFDSRREAARYSELKLLERAGVIKDLRLQVPFEFRHNDVLICRYYADFTYLELTRNGGPKWLSVVEDSKGGVHTKEYILKKKLMRAFYAIELRET